MRYLIMARSRWSQGLELIRFVIAAHPPAERYSTSRPFMCGICMRRQANIPEL